MFEIENFKESITNKTFFSRIISGTPNFLVKGQKWLPLRCLCSQNVLFRAYYERVRAFFKEKNISPDPPHNKNYDEKR